MCHYIFMHFRLRKKRIYLDYAAATPVRKEVLKKMKPHMYSHFGNAGAIHAEGVFAKKSIAEARERLASTLRIRPEGIVFTASGTESNNLALLGVIESLHRKGRAYADMEVVSSAIEHASVLEVLMYLQSKGVVMRYVAVDAQGVISLPSLQECLTEKTVLVTFAYVNSEIGTIQPIRKIARTVRKFQKDTHTQIHIHSDAAQAPLWLPCALDQLACDSLTLDAGKCYGPKGIGVLAFTHGVSLIPLYFGGGQEAGYRPGTENTASIVGAVESLCIAQELYEERSVKTVALRDMFITELLTLEGCILNGSREDRVANNVHISIPGVDSEFAVICLDEAGIACATKSACGGAKGDGSTVVRAITGDNARSKSTIRFTLGEATTKSEIRSTVNVLRSHIAIVSAQMDYLTKK